MGKKKEKPEKNYYEVTNEISRGMEEFESAWQEFFKNKPRPKNDEEDRKQQEEFNHWYNYIRKQSDTGKTPVEMYKEVYGKEPPENPAEASRIMNFEWDEDYKEPDEMLEEANEFLEKGKPKEALRIIDDVLEIVKDDEEVLLLKARILCEMHDFKKAEKVLELSFKVNGETDDWRFSYANFLFVKGDFVGAYMKIKDFYDSDPANFDWVISHAQYSYWNNEKGWEKMLNEARKIGKRRVDDFYKNIWIKREALFKGPFLGELLDFIMVSLESGKEEIALENIRFALRNREFIPSDIVDMLLGLELESCIVSKNFDEANKRVEELIKRNNKNPHAYFYNAQLLFYQSKLSEALFSIDKCLEIAEEKIPHPDFYLLKSQILRELDNDEYIYFENKAKELMKGLGAFKDILFDQRV